MHAALAWILSNDAVDHDDFFSGFVLAEEMCDGIDLPFSEPTIFASGPICGLRWARWHEDERGKAKYQR